MSGGKPMKALNTAIGVAFILLSVMQSSHGMTSGGCPQLSRQLTNQVDQCWFMANNAPTHDRNTRNKKRRFQNECQRVTNGANALVNWCNNNLHRCNYKVMNYSLVDHSFGEGLLDSGRWEARCSR